ncbi:MAG: hypothetical protein HY769_07460 [Candidatus Stahlbacteria bacterium]|nr:hypothetical protein [Candidatus Stahlbacteria bacterium]
MCVQQKWWINLCVIAFVIPKVMAEGIVNSQNIDKEKLRESLLDEKCAYRKDISIEEHCMVSDGIVWGEVNKVECKFEPETVKVADTLTTRYEVYPEVNTYVTVKIKIWIAADSINIKQGETIKVRFRGGIAKKSPDGDVQAVFPSCIGGTPTARDFKDRKEVILFLKQWKEEGIFGLALNATSIYFVERDKVKPLLKYMERQKQPIREFWKIVEQNMYGGEK